MNFYKLWFEAKEAGINEASFIIEFLNQTTHSQDVLINGEIEDLINFSNVVLNTSLEKLIDNLIHNKQEIKQERIVQFSNYENGVYEVNKILLFENKSLDFNEIGKKLINAKLDGACKKYGENHSKLACELNLVVLKKEKRFMVRNTAFGNFCISLSNIDKEELFKRLWLRNPFIKEMILLSKTGNCNYENLASLYLSKSTLLRRKTNIKFIITKILKDTSYEYLLNNIIW